MSRNINKYFKVQPFAFMQYFYKSEGLPRIKFFIQLEDHIDEKLLREAVNLSIDAVPLINCVFDEEEFIWKQANFNANDIVNVVDENDNKWFTTELDSTHEPQLKIIVLRQSTHDKLLFIINHMITDGCGFKNYMYLLCDLYNKCEKDECCKFNYKDFRKQSLRQISGNFSLYKKWKILFSKLNVSMPPESFKFALKGDSHNAVVLTRNIERDNFDNIKKYAKHKGASINDMIITAYMREIYRRLGTSDITIPCPVDLRKFKKKKQIFGICNLTGLYNCTVRMSDSEAFDETLDKVTEQMNAQKSSTACMKLPMLLNIIYNVVPLRILIKKFSNMRMTPFITYTNLGIIDDRRLYFGNHNIESAYITTAIKKNPYFQLSVSTFKDRCTLSVSLFAAEEDVKLVNDILDNIKNELNKNLHL